MSTAISGGKFPFPSDERDRRGGGVEERGKRRGKVTRGKVRHSREGEGDECVVTEERL
jgi:hypothetical protein